VGCHRRVGVYRQTNRLDMLGTELSQSPLTRNPPRWPFRSSAKEDAALGSSNALTASENILLRWINYHVNATMPTVRRPTLQVTCCFIQKPPSVSARITAVPRRNRHTASDSVLHTGPEHDQRERLYPAVSAAIGPPRETQCCIHDPFPIPTGEQGGRGVRLRAAVAGRGGPLPRARLPRAAAQGPWTTPRGILHRQQGEDRTRGWRRWDRKKWEGGGRAPERLREFCLVPCSWHMDAREKEEESSGGFRVVSSLTSVDPFW
jgi:hypothetical protein